MVLVFRPLPAPLHPSWIRSCRCAGAVGAGRERLCWACHCRKDEEQGRTRNVLEVTFLSFLEKASDVLLRVQSSDRVTSVSLPAAPAYHMIEFELEVLSLPSAPVTGGESSTLGTTEPHRKHKDTHRAGHCMATTDHKVRRGQEGAARAGGLCWSCLFQEMPCVQVADFPFLTPHPLAGLGICLFESPFLDKGYACKDKDRPGCKFSTPAREGRIVYGRR